MNRRPSEEARAAVVNLAYALADSQKLAPLPKWHVNDILHGLADRYYSPVTDLDKNSYLFNLGHSVYSNIAEPHIADC